MSRQNYFVCPRCQSVLDYDPQSHIDYAIPAAPVWATSLPPGVLASITKDSPPVGAAATGYSESQDAVLLTRGTEQMPVTGPNNGQAGSPVEAQPAVAGIDSERCPTCDEGTRCGDPWHQR